MRALAPLAAQLVLLAAASARADAPPDEPLSLEGFSGVLHTPSAWVHTPGTAHLLFTDAADPRYWGGTTHTFVTSLALFRYLELAGRITDAHAPSVWVRDLSANLKLQLPLDWIFHRPELPFAIALGTQDEGGAAPHYRTRYAVASVRAGPLSVSAGYGTGPDRMRGVFGGASLHVTRFAEVLGDHDARRWSAGLRVGAELSLLGAPFRISATGSRVLVRGAPDFEWAAELAVPLGSSVGAPRIEEPEVAAALEASPEPCGPGLRTLLRDLADVGLENLRVGQDRDAVVVEYENDVYRHAEADGLGLVLGLVARDAPPGLPAFRVLLLRAQVPVLEVAGPTASLRAFFLRTAEVAPALEAAMTVTVRPGPREAQWLDPEVRRWAGFRPRVGIGPGLQTLIATELSVLEYVLSVRPELVVLLWPGATGYARWDVPFAYSQAYRSGGLLYARRPNAVLLEGLLYQAVPLAPGLTALAGAGVIESSRTGGLGQLMWTSPGGGHALGVEGAATRDLWSGERRNSLTGSYRVWIDGLDAMAELRAGQFLAGDRGAAVRFSRFFGSTRVGLVMERTDTTIAGVEITLPLSPRREMSPGLFQVRGDNRFAYGVGTVVGERYNYVRSGVASPPLTRWNLQDAFLDRGRLDREELVAALPRARALFLRDAGAIAPTCEDQGIPPEHGTQAAPRTNNGSSLSRRHGHRLDRFAHRGTQCVLS